MSVRVFACTGHRLKTLGYSQETNNRLATITDMMLDDFEADRMLIGMAVGFDQAMAHACIRAKVEFDAYVPFPDQDKIWPLGIKADYRMLLTKARRVIYTMHETPKYINEAFIIRDRAMVDDGEGLLALWNGLPSGTGATVIYAELIGKPIYNYWSYWMNL